MEQGSKAWLDLRKKYITSTDASVICDLNPWQTKYGLWREKMDLAPPKEENEAMRMGRQLEPIAREWFIKETGIEMIPRIQCNGIFMASLDGYSAKEKCILEIKSGQKAFQMACGQEVPEYYQCQIQHQLLTLGCSKAFYCAYWDGKGHIIEIKRDEDFLGEYIPKANEFYQCMINYEAPPFVAKDYIIIDTDEWKMATEGYRKASDEIKKLEETQRQYKEKLLELSQGKISRGNGIRVTKIVKKGAIDYPSIPQLNGVDTEPYRKPSIEYWSVNIEKEK